MNLLHRYTCLLKRVALLSVIFWFFLPSGGTQERIASDFNIRYIGYAEGLSDRNVMSICHDRNGAVWFGTRAGLFRYDGHDIQLFSIEGTDTKNSMPKIHQIQNVLQDSAGVLWVFSRSFVYAIMPDLINWCSSSWSAFPGLDSKGRCIARGEHALERLTVIEKNDQYIIQKEKLPMQGSQILSLNAGKSLAVYDNLVDSVTVWQNDISPAFSFEFKDNPNLRPINLSAGVVLEFAQDRAWYLDTLQKKFVPITDTATFDISRNPFAIQHAIDSFISRHPAGPLEQFSGKIPLPNSVEPDRHGNLWVGTSAGVFIFNPRKRIFHQLDAFRGKSLRAIHIQDGGLIASAQDTLISIDLNSLNTTGKRWVGAGVRVLAPVGANRLMAAGDFSGLFFLDTRDITRQIPFKPLDTRHHFSHLIDKKGRLWLGGYIPGIWQYDENKYKCSARAFDLGFVEIYTLSEDARENIWAAGLSAFYKISNDSIGSNLLTESMERPEFTSSIIRGDSLWLTTRAQGLWCFDLIREKFVRTFSSVDGLPNDGLNSILADEIGFFWISTNKGLSRFSPEKGSFLNFGRDDGVENEEFNLHSAFKDPRTGKIYFGGMNGVTYFDPLDVQKMSITPDVFLSKVVLPDKRSGQLVTIFPKFNQSEPILLAPETRYIEFHLASTDYYAAGHNRYLYRLDGFDTDWILAGTNPLVRYTNLEAKDYVFRYKTINPDGNESPERQIRLVVGEIFYKSWWFQLLLVALAGAIGWSFVLVRERRMREIMEVRRSIAADLHDDVAATMHFLSMQIKSLRTRPPDEFEEIKMPVSKLAQMDDAADESLSKLSDIVWAIDIHQRSLGDLANRLQDYAGDFLWQNGVPVQFHISIDRKEGSLNPKVRQHLLLIVKEAVNNIVRHTNSFQVHFRLENQANWLTIHIENFYTETRKPNFSGGNGLENMKHRAEQIEATVNINRSEGHFEILLHIPKIFYR